MRAEAEIRMQKFLRGASLGKTIQEHLQFKEAKKKMRNMLQDQEGWTKMNGSKRHGIVGYTKRYEVKTYLNVTRH
jgi:hypothetical protein